MHDPDFAMTYARLTRITCELRAEVDITRSRMAEARETLAHATRAAIAARGVVRRDPQCRVMIVEDDADTCDRIQRSLNGAGRLAESARDPAAALTLARYFRPDVALLDLDGWELAGHLRRLPRPMHMIAVSDRADEDDHRRSRDAGFCSLVVTPIDLPALDRLLSGLAPIAA